MTKLPEQKQLKLPKLRSGLTFSFGDYDREGKPQWMIHDAGRNKFFIIGWVEYEILERWALGDAEKIIEAVNLETTLHIDKNDIENVLRFLAYNYLIHQSGYQIYKHAKDQKLFKKDNLFHLIITYYLFFRIPLVHPDQFLQRTLGIARWVFSRATFFIMLGLGVIAIYQLDMQWEKFTHTFSSIFTWQGLFLSLIAYMICKLCHELGHAYMCRQYGVPVPSLGVAFLVFWPVLYTDTTLSWSLNYKQRMHIALAGMWVETYITIIAALLWCNVSNLTIQAICYVTITVNWMASLLINVSPFMRFDGYYVLADYLKMPNLQPRAFALTRWQIRRWLFNWPDAPPEMFTKNMHYFLVAYSIITWIYRLFLYIGIAVLVYHFFIKIIGILLFVIELFVFVLGPIVTEIQSWYAFKDKFSFNIRTKLTLIISSVFLLLFFLPIRESVSLPGTLSYDHQFLISPEEGVLQNKLPAIGSHIKANEPIVQIDSPYLDFALRKVTLEYQKKLGELRRSSIEKTYSSMQSVLLSDLNKQQAEYRKLMQLRSELVLTVPFNGIVIDIASDIYPGSTLMKAEWLGDVINPAVVHGEAYVSQLDVNDLKVGLTGKFYSDNLSAISVKIVSIEVLHTSKLTCQYSTEVKHSPDDDIVVETPCYNASELGGEVATLFTDKGEYVPVNSVFRVLFITQKPVKLNHIERGSIMIDTNGRSYAGWVFYKLKTLLVKQSGL